MNKTVTLICFLFFATTLNLFANETSDIDNIKNTVISSCMSVKNVEVILNPQESNPAQYDLKFSIDDGDQNNDNDTVLLCKAYINSSKQVHFEECQQEFFPYPLYFLDGLFSVFLNLNIQPGACF
jgi:hypothetical protein